MPASSSPAGSHRNKLMVHNNEVVNALASPPCFSGTSPRPSDFPCPLIMIVGAAIVSFGGLPRQAVSDFQPGRSVVLAVNREDRNQTTPCYSDLECRLYSTHAVGDPASCRSTVSRILTRWPSFRRPLKIDAAVLFRHSTKKSTRWSSFHCPRGIAASALFSEFQSRSIEQGQAASPHNRHDPQN